VPFILEFTRNQLNFLIAIDRKSENVLLHQKGINFNVCFNLQ